MKIMKKHNEEIQFLKYKCNKSKGKIDDII